MSRAKGKPRRGDFANGVLDGSYRKVVVFMKCTQKSSDNPLPGRSYCISYTHRKHHKEDHHGTDQKELEEVLELLNTKQYTKLRQYLAELNDADIAGLLEELEEEDMLKVFRILPKDHNGRRFFPDSNMDNQQKIITSLSDKEATNIINNLMADDAADLLEEMPANIVKKLQSKALRYAEISIICCDIRKIPPEVS